MKYLKRFESLSDSIKIPKENREDIHNICEKYGIQNYTINEDGSIDVDGDVYLHDERLTKLPLNFRNVTGSFYCHHNQLTSLEGCPKTVGGYFDCRFNNLTSLEGCPKFIGSAFMCNHNNIITFEYLPFSVGGYFHCGSNPIKEIWDLFRDYSKIEFLNDCDAIREPDDDSEEPIIILERLNFFLEEIGKKTVAKVKGYKCI